MVLNVTLDGSCGNVFRSFLCEKIRGSMLANRYKYTLTREGTSRAGMVE
jgi:hypothetical protein